MFRRTLFAIVGALVLLITGAVVGTFVGIDIGGNYFPAFEFAGSRGYEATGLIGFWVGAALGAVLGAWLGSRIGRRSKA